MFTHVDSSKPAKSYFVVVKRGPLPSSDTIITQDIGLYGQFDCAFGRSSPRVIKQYPPGLIFSMCFAASKATYGLHDPSLTSNEKQCLDSGDIAVHFSPSASEHGWQMLAQP